jgi:phenylalanyl-tRNA synthetase beta chain
MRVPYTWLQDYLPQAPPPEALQEILTLGGLEVEEIQTWRAAEADCEEPVLLTSVTANRGDMLSMIGVARQAAALLGAEWAMPPVDLSLLGEPIRDRGKAASKGFTVEIVDPVGCPRYSGLLVQGVKIGPSPEWLRLRLEAAGVRAISNVVDATNYVCWELGQPMHAFDFRFIQDRHVVVRRAKPGEEVMLIDESVPPLTAEDVVIADPLGAVALAGVMGGADSQVRASTTTVLLEAAHFDPTAIRKTCLRLGMSSEASYRFERHVDPNLTLPALARAAALILEIAVSRETCCSVEIAGPAVDVSTRDFPPCAVSLRPRRCNAILGTDLSAAQMSDYLTRLGCTIAPGETPETLAVEVPTFRPEVEREIDVIEEVAIVHGYNNLPITVPGGLAGSARLTREQQIERRAREILRRCGLNETLSFSMFCPVDLDKLHCERDAPERRLLGLSNPMSADATVLRTTLLPALLTACAYNQSRRVADLALYELSRVFFACAGADLPEERLRVAGILAGSPWTSRWNLPEESRQVDFFWLKGLVEQFLEELGLKEVAILPGLQPTFAAGVCAEVRLGEQTLGWLGEVAPEVAEAYDVEGSVLAFELDFTAIQTAACLVKPYRPLPRLPAALRDVAVTLPEATSAAAIAAEIRAAAGEYLESVEPFDLYHDPQRLGAGRKSVAFELAFRAPDRTLTDAELDAAMSSVHARLEAIGGEVRK